MTRTLVALVSIGVAFILGMGAGQLLTTCKTSPPSPPTNIRIEPPPGRIVPR